MGPFLQVKRFKVLPRFLNTVLVHIAIAACSFKTRIGALRRLYFLTRRVGIDFDTFLIQEQKVSTSAILQITLFFLPTH
jgi:hypothetical protein